MDYYAENRYNFFLKNLFFDVTAAYLSNNPIRKKKKKTLLDYLYSLF